MSSWIRAIRLMLARQMLARGLRFASQIFLHAGIKIKRMILFMSTINIFYFLLLNEKKNINSNTTRIKPRFLWLIRKILHFHQKFFRLGKKNTKKKRQTERRNEGRRVDYSMEQEPCS